MNQLIVVITFLMIFLSGCERKANDNSENISESNAISPEEIAPITARSQGIIINPNGWQIPMPKSRKNIKETKTFGTTAKGNTVEVVVIGYDPTKDFFYKLEIDSKPQLRAFTGLLRLVGIEELSSNEKVFGYTIWARQVSDKTETYEHNHTFVYRCYDSDGDGKFETMVIDTSAFQVPNWVKE